MARGGAHGGVVSCGGVVWVLPSANTVPKLWRTVGGVCGDSYFSNGLNGGGGSGFCGRCDAIGFAIKK